MYRVFRSMYLSHFEGNYPCESNYILGDLSRRIVRPNVTSTNLSDHDLPYNWYRMPGFRITSNANASCEAQYPWYLAGM